MLKKVIVGLFCFVLLAVSGVGAYVYTLNWNKHKKLVSQRFSQITGLNSSIEGNLKVEYFPTPKFSAGKVSFWKGNDKRNPLIEIDEVVANVELMPLLDNKFNLSSMILTKPTFNISVSENGVSNWAEVGGKGKNKAGNIEVSFKDIKLNNATIHYNNAQKNKEFDIPNISATVSAPSLRGPYKTDGKVIHNNNEMKFAGNITNNNGIKLNMNISNNASNTKATIEGTFGRNAEGLFTFDTKNFEKISNIILGKNSVNPIYNEDFYISFKYSNQPDALKLENFTTKYGANTVGTGTVDIKTVNNQTIADAVFKMNKVDLDIFKNISNDYINKYKSEASVSDIDFSKYNFNLTVNADSAFYNGSESKNLIAAIELKDALLNVSRLGLVMPGNTNIKTLGSVDLKTMNYKFNNTLESEDFRIFASVFGVDVTKLASTENKKSIFKSVTANVDFSGDLNQQKISIPNATFDSTALKGNIGLVKAEDKNVALADLELSKIIFDRYIDVTDKASKNPTLKDKFVHQMNLLPWNKNWNIEASIAVGNSVFNNIPLEGVNLNFSNNFDSLKVNKLTINNVAGTYLDIAFDAENIKSNPNFNELTFNVKSNDLPLFASTVGINLGTKKLFNRKIFATQGVLTGLFDEFYLSSVQKFDDVEFSYTGKVNNGDKIFVDGDIELKSDNFVNMLKDYGSNYTPDIPLTSFTISGKLVGTNDLFEFSNINSYLGANKLSGNLTVDNTESKIKLKGNFDIDKLELARWFDFDDRLLASETLSNESFISKPIFIDDKIDYSSFNNVDFNLTASIKSLVYNNNNYEKTSIDATLIDGVLNVSKFNTHLGDNNIYLDFILDSSKMTSISGNYDFRNVKLPNIGGATYLVKNGLLDINGEFSSLATSKKDFFSNLNSNGRFKLNNASIDGFDFDIIKFEFEQAKSTNGFEDKILNSLKSGTSSFPVVEGSFDITRGVIVSDNMKFQSPVIDMNSKFNLNLNDWLFIMNNEALFHNASFSDILEFKMMGYMKNPSISVDLTETFERIGSREKLSSDMIKKEEERKVNELNDKIKSIEKNINSTLTTISRIHYDVARFKPLSSNEDVLKTYDNNIHLLQQTEASIKKIKEDIFKANDIETLVNLNNKFLAEDAKLKFIPKTLEDNFIIDEKYIFDDIFNKIAWVYNVIQNNSSHYNNLTDVYMQEVEFSKTSENPISKSDEEMLIKSITTVKNISTKATELHGKFRDNYLSMIDTNKVADMKDNNEIAKQALQTMLTYAKQLNSDIVISLDKFREILDIKARDYLDFMIGVPNTIEEIDITKKTTPEYPALDNVNDTDTSHEETKQEASASNVSEIIEVVVEKLADNKKIEEEKAKLSIDMNINKGFSGLISNFSKNALNKKQEKVISNIAFSGLSNILPKEEPKKVEVEEISKPEKVEIEKTSEPMEVEIAQIDINESVLPVKNDNAAKEAKVVIENKLSFSDKLKSSIKVALSKIKNLEDMIGLDNNKNDVTASNNDTKDENSVMANVSETMKVNPVIALNISSETIVSEIDSDINNNETTIKKTDSTFKRKEVANVVKSLNNPSNINTPDNVAKIEDTTTLIASASVYDIDNNTKSLTSEYVSKQNTLSNVLVNGSDNKFLFPANDTIIASGDIGKSMHKNNITRVEQAKANKYLFAMNDNIKSTSGEIGKIAFLTVK